MEFTPWSKTPRLFRGMVVTEKIDGTNAAIRIKESGGYVLPRDAVTYVGRGEGMRTVYAQSRNRFVIPGDDNHGFAQWVRDNAESLVGDLGPGIHFGEWWGQGIQRGYGLTEKRFSLFNTEKWGGTLFSTPELHVVPVLGRGPFDTDTIRDLAEGLSSGGSVASPGFANPEGVCVYHLASRQVFKYTTDGDGHKG